MALHVYVTDADEFFVAENLDQAKQLVANFMQEGDVVDPDELSDILDTVVKMPDDKVLAIEDEEQDRLEKKTCAQWALENGPGFLFCDCG